MITAKEALALPSAAISSSDLEAATGLLGDLDAFVRTNMTYGGCVMSVASGRLNRNILTHLTVELQRCGWIFECRNVVAQSAITGQPHVVEHQLALVPGDTARQVRP